MFSEPEQETAADRLDTELDEPQMQPDGQEPEAPAAEIGGNIDDGPITNDTGQVDDGHLNALELDALTYDPGLRKSTRHTAGKPPVRYGYDTDRACL